MKRTIDGLFLRTEADWSPAHVTKNWNQGSYIQLAPEYDTSTKYEPVEMLMRGFIEGV